MSLSNKKDEVSSSPTTSSDDVKNNKDDVATAPSKTPPHPPSSKKSTTPPPSSYYPRPPSCTGSNVTQSYSTDVNANSTPIRSSNGNTPVRATNNYANTNTPIMSAKRPRRRVSGNAPNPGSDSGSRTPVRTLVDDKTPGTQTPANATAFEDDEAHGLRPHLSPMHAVRPVPRDSHHVRNHSSSHHDGQNRSPTADPQEPCRSNQDKNHVNSNNSNRHRLGNDDDGESPSNRSSASWVGRKVDALFSPVLSFLHGATNAAAASATSSNSPSEVAILGSNSVSTSSWDIHCAYNEESSGRSSCNKKGNETSSVSSKLNFKDDGRDDVANIAFSPRIHATYSTDEDDDDDHKALAVSNAIRDALREAANDLQEEGEEEHHTSYGTQQQYYHSMTIKNTDSSSDSFDNIPSMAITESSGGDGNYSDVGKEILLMDDDGDVNMVDCYQQQRTSQTSETSSSISAHAASNNHSIQQHKSDEGDEEEEEEEFNPYLFIKSLPPYKYAIPPGWSTRPKTLPPFDPHADPPIPPICLGLDLDETLVHCTVEPIPDAHMVFPVDFNGMEYQVHVRCRPFLTEFLEAVHQKFEVVVFTASQQVYADKLLDKIDPGECRVACDGRRVRSSIASLTP